MIQWLYSIISYALSQVEDEDIRSVLEFALNLSHQHVQFIQNLLTNEQIAVRNGFTAQDVNLNAPRLFTDDLILLRQKCVRCLIYIIHRVEYYKY
ncbi:DUF3231 family protein [Virgibacillus sp. NKC19-16]|uniref:DUF3231 family protein n=1 Tax=Virgibacillus salidurans TaxID=2831673 RepID=UPI001F463C0F|nr:DUF3231 family protein [Virgibacillus sp. NKC19-16]UJL47163.1 DUF3231 family protein [Virgibacillus sp. NKC19-16]